MRDCDHANLITPYCPHCGEASDKSGLSGLRLHLTRTLGQKRMALKRTMKWLSGPDDADTKSLQQAKRLVEKWESWVAAFDDLIQRAGANDHESPPGS